MNTRYSIEVTRIPKIDVEVDAFWPAIIIAAAIFFGFSVMSKSAAKEAVFMDCMSTVEWNSKIDRDRQFEICHSMVQRVKW